MRKALPITKFSEKIFVEENYKYRNKTLSSTFPLRSYLVISNFLACVGKKENCGFFI